MRAPSAGKEPNVPKTVQQDSGRFSPFMGTRRRRSRKRRAATFVRVRGPLVANNFS